MSTRLQNRVSAGRSLAASLARYRDTDAIVVGLPRGGVPVAYEVATALHLPLDVIVVRKLGVPFQPELAMGAIGEGNVLVRNDDVIHGAIVHEDEVRDVARREREELDRRVAVLRGGRPRLSLEGRTVLVVDDGIATGATVRAACHVARAAGAAHIVVATPVVAPRTVIELKHDADEVVYLDAPEPFFSVGQFYVDFAPVSDGEVVRLLARARQANDPPPVDEELALDIGGVRVGGRLAVPDGAPGIVLFAHGSGSSRHSPRNRAVAAGLQQRGYATLLFDLLTEDEEVDRANVFDIELLGARLVAATNVVRARSDTSSLDIAFFGASTGGAAALVAAAELGEVVSSVVSRGGRPDLAADRLRDVVSPTMLIVGSRDPIVFGLNAEARAAFKCEARLEVVIGATHLFEEPGALDEVVRLAAGWFGMHWRADRGFDG